MLTRTYLFTQIYSLYKSIPQFYLQHCYCTLLKFEELRFPILSTLIQTFKGFKVYLEFMTLRLSLLANLFSAGFFPTGADTD